jgi:hypothetical protein
MTADQLLTVCQCRLPEDIPAQLHRLRLTWSFIRYITST